MRRRLVVDRDGTLGRVLAPLGVEGARALGDGRVFVGRRRARGPGDLVRRGDEVRVFAPRASAAVAWAGVADVRILGERDGVVAAAKPAHAGTVPDHRGGAGTLRDEVARRLGLADGDALHPTSRLDVGVSGVVLFARTPEARERLARARLARAYVRRYVAIAVGAPDPPAGTWRWPIGRADDPRLRRAGGRGAAPAETAYALVAASPAGPALIALLPRTGRTHQIRVHAAQAGVPLLGDRAYGGPSRTTLVSGKVIAASRIALHAARVEVPDASGRPWRVEDPPPDSLRRWWRDLGGDDGAWERAMRADVPG